MYKDITFYSLGSSSCIFNMKQTAFFFPSGKSKGRFCLCQGIVHSGDFAVVFVHPEGTLFSFVSQRPDLHFAGFNLRREGAVL